MKKENIFKYFGLDKKETNVYLACLELGVATASDIARKAGIQRTYFYDLSTNLMGLGLLKEIKQGSKRLFTATDPEELLKIQQERLKEVQTAIPQLKALHNTAGEKSKVFYYEGADGIDQINNDSLRYEGEIIGFTTPRFVTAKNKKLSQEFIKRRVAIGKKSRIIGQISPELQQLQLRDKKELRETRMISQDIFSSEVEVGIYGNRVFVANYKSQSGMIIEDSDYADTLKKIFEIVWDSGKVVH